MTKKSIFIQEILFIFERVIGFDDTVGIVVAESGALNI